MVHFSLVKHDVGVVVLLLRMFSIRAIFTIASLHIRLFAPLRLWRKAPAAHYISAKITQKNYNAKKKECKNAACRAIVECCMLLYAVRWPIGDVLPVGLGLALLIL